MKIFTTFSSIEDYLNNNYEPAHDCYHPLSECSFINGKNNYKVRFMYEHISDEIQIAPVMDSQQFTSLADVNLYENWKYLLVKIFGVRFVVHRVDNTFIVHAKDGYDISEFKVYRTASEIALPDTYQDSTRVGETTSISLHNKELQVIAPQNMLESVCCRTTVLYMLAQAYMKRMKKELDTLITLGNEEKPKKGFFLKKENIIDILFQKATEFKIRYILDMPLKKGRVEDSAQIWKLIYQFYDVKQYVIDLDSKMKDIKLLLDNKGMNKLTATGNKIAYIATAIGLAGLFVGIVSAIGTYLPYIIEWNK